jgi:hypothetical protein
MKKDSKKNSAVWALLVLLASLFEQVD